MKAMDEQIAGNNVIPGSLLQTFEKELADALAGYGADPEVVGFKSIACYRTGLDVAPAPEKIGVLERAVMTLILVYAARRTLRLADKALNDYVVHAAMRAATWDGATVGLLLAYTAAMFILYTVAPLLYRASSATYYNISLLTSDFYGLLFGLFLFVSTPGCPRVLSI